MRSLIWLTTCFLSVGSFEVQAQPAAAQAETLFRNGKDLLSAGKTAEACAAFEASQKLAAATTTLLNLANCREKNNQLATAWGLFVEAERETRVATDDASRELHALAADRAAKLEARLSKLTITVDTASWSAPIPALEILRNGEALQQGTWNQALPVDGGTYLITARAPNHAEWTTTIVIAISSDAKSVAIPQLQLVEAKPQVVATLSEPSEPRHERRSLVAPLVVGGVAVVAFGTALGFELSGRSLYSDAKAEKIDNERRQELWDSANTRHYVAQGLAVAGVAAGGVALWLFLRGRGEAASSTAERLKTPRRRISLESITIGDGTLHVAGRF